MVRYKIVVFPFPQSTNVDTYDIADETRYDMSASPVFRLSRQECEAIVASKEMVGKPILDSHTPRVLGSIIDSYINNLGELCVEAEINEKYDATKFEFSIGYDCFLRRDTKAGKVKVEKKVVNEVSMCQKGKEPGCFAVKVMNSLSKPMRFGLLNAQSCSDSLKENEKITYSDITHSKIKVVYTLESRIMSDITNKPQAVVAQQPPAVVENKVKKVELSEPMYNMLMEKYKVEIRNKFQDFAAVLVGDGKMKKEDVGKYVEDMTVKSFQYNAKKFESEKTEDNGYASAMESMVSDLMDVVMKQQKMLFGMEEKMSGYEQRLKQFSEQRAEKAEKKEEVVPLPMKRAFSNFTTADYKVQKETKSEFVDNIHAIQNSIATDRKVTQNVLITPDEFMAEYRKSLVK